MEELARRALLFDFYSPLLTKKQQEIYDLYYQQDLSLGEIAENQKVSRQAVFDLLRRTEESLRAYEDRLGLVQKHLDCCGLLAEIKEEIAVIENKHQRGELLRLRNLLDTLEMHW